MIHIPHCVEFEMAMHQGQVFYFSDDSLGTQEPHYCVLLNHSPVQDNSLLFLAATSQLEKFNQRAIARGYLPETLVTITPANSDGIFTKESYFDCNKLLPPLTKVCVLSKQNSISEKIKGVLPLTAIERLVAGVCASPHTSPMLKSLIKK